MTRKLREELIGALIGLAKACGNNPCTEDTISVLLRGLTLSSANARAGKPELQEAIEAAHREKYRISPNCLTCQARCGNTDDYDCQLLWTDEPYISSLKALILFSLQEMAGTLTQAKAQGCQSPEEDDFLLDALSVLGYELESKDLLPVAIKAGRMCVQCRNLTAGNEA